MAGPMVEVVGARRLRSTLRKAGKDLTVMKEANAAAARIVLDDARRRVPTRTGTLKSTLRSTGTLTSGIVRAGFQRVPYAGPIHWGWPARSIKPTPFMSDAAAATQNAWLAAYEKGIDKALSQIKGQ